MRCTFFWTNGNTTEVDVTEPPPPEVRLDRGLLTFAAHFGVSLPQLPPDAVSSVFDRKRWRSDADERIVYVERS